MTDTLKTIFAAIFLALFIALWTWIGVIVLNYTPTDDAPVAVVPQPLALVGGLAAGAVAAATAAALGINAEKVKVKVKVAGTDTEEEAQATTFGQRATAATSSWFIVVAAVAYVLVGVGMLVIWLIKGAVAPELLSAFATSAFGWLAGAFTGALPTKQS